ncbi:uncharacterized protein N7458_000981 [Penicillium daleae]|uniref:Fumarylacetoacetase-like C-terminal domain-containing protein n=1 Tax=Penicillium daleae TaxID=63821 RepID=A0AAD6G8C4_9EURO|nr:uncharacterized protein N7458_000981 [Penicillium daleae]KAJ5465295.1 hypothetical protein N7458_000981 [Penicillium daleae]
MAIGGVEIRLDKADSSKYPDVGIAVLDRDRVVVNLIQGSVFDAVGIKELPVFRCLGLNYCNHAKEANMLIPDCAKFYTGWLPRLGGRVINHFFPRSGRDISESDVTEYELDIPAVTISVLESSSSVTASAAFKGIDGSCPLDPVLISCSIISHSHILHIKEIYNGYVVQESNTRRVYPES